MEIDEAAARIARWRLWLALSQACPTPSGARPSLRIETGDSLEDDLWGKRFGSIAPGGRFDVIVGNPPYQFLSGKGSPARRLERAGHHPQATRLRQRFERLARRYADTSQGCRDLYKWFFQLAVERLEPDGWLAYVTPNTWLTLRRYEDVRALLCRSGNVEQVIDLGFGGFREVTAPSAVTFFTKRKRPARRMDYVDLRAVGDPRALRRALARLRPDAGVSTPIEGATFAFGPDALARRLYERRDAGQFGQIAMVREGEHGLRPRSTPLFEHPGPGRTAVLMDRSLQPWREPPLRYISNQAIAPFSLERHRGPRLLLRKTSERLVCAQAPERLALAHQNVYLVVARSEAIPIEAIQTLLSSRLLSYLYRHGPCGQGVRPLAQLRVHGLNALPLPPLARLRDRADRLAELARKARGRAAENQSLEALEKEIESAVGQLYGLKRHEQARVQAAMSRPCGSQPPGQASKRERV